MSNEVILRPAAPDEAAALSELAVRSKGHWGYDDAFLSACREELRVDPSDCDGTHVVVADTRGSLVGFAQYGGSPPEGDLSKLFLEPYAIGTGVGGSLMAWLRDAALADGFSSLMVDSDPNAEAFYLRFGARRVALTPSGSIPGRVLPLLRWELGPERL